MRDVSHLPSQTGASTVDYIEGTGTAAGQVWIPWTKPRGKTMINIFLVGKGANGGSGVVGANSTAAGGGGGGSGGQTHLTMPLAMLPDTIFFSLAGVVTGSQMLSYVTVAPRLAAGAGAALALDTLMIAYGGTVGGNASGATAGIAGVAGAIATVGLMPLGWPFATLSLAGQAGIIGGTTVGAANLSLLLTGIRVTGGGGGGGLPATATNGTLGSAITNAGTFPTLAAPSLVSVATVPPGHGSGGLLHRQPFFNYGGVGAGSTHGSATGAGLVQARGGDGAPGCGGGGMGGALTGSTAAVIANGGPSFAIITCW